LLKVWVAVRYVPPGVGDPVAPPPPVELPLEHAVASTAKLATTASPTTHLFLCMSSSFLAREPPAIEVYVV